MLAASTHLGDSNVHFQMMQYVFRRRSDGVCLIDIKKTWEKLLLAARVIAAIENPADVCVISSRNFGQRAVLKFASHTGATPIAGRFTPGTFTNQIQAAFREPRLLVITDPAADHQSIQESSYVNIPVIAFCNTNSPTKYVDIAIPCNINSSNSIGLMWWLLAREVKRMRGDISRNLEWEVMPDLYFYREEKPEEEEEAQAPDVTPAQDTFNAATTETTYTAPAAVDADANTMIAPTSTYAPKEDWQNADTNTEWGAEASNTEWGADTATDNWGAS